MNIFNEGFIDTELFWLSFGDLITYSIIIFEIGLVIWLILKYVIKNIKFGSKSDSNPIIINSGTEQNHSDTDSQKKDLKAIEVDFKKDIFIDKKTNNENIIMDKVIKGKVKTQKDKLKQLRGK